MIKYFKYLGYLLKHKWYVGIECFKRGLYWQGIVHDISKFRLSEFVPYANFFYGKDAKPRRDDTGYYKPTDTGDIKFELAWFLHQKRNSHHWQYWVLPEDRESVRILPIPEKVEIEMLCDWIGAGKAQGYFPPKDDPLFNVRKWWQANNSKMALHPDVIKYFDNLLGGVK